MVAKTTEEEEEDHDGPSRSQVAHPSRLHHSVPLAVRMG
jgi:hypothetical protein